MDSEKEFLQSYDMSKFERPSVTTDIAAFTVRSESDGNYRQDPKNTLSLLLIKRGGHPYKGCWALPGGFLEPTETVEECALREVTEETGITPSSILPVGVFSEPGRDPRGWIISNAFASVIGEELIKERAGDDAAEAAWFDVTFDCADNGVYVLELKHGDVKMSALLEEADNSFGKKKFTIKDSGSLAFDHAKIIASALTELRREAKNFDAIFDFLPEKFTLTSLQRVQETIMNISVQPANFRRKAAEHVVETDEYLTGAGHRPAKLFRRKYD